MNGNKFYLQVLGSFKIKTNQLQTPPSNTSADTFFCQRLLISTVTLKILNVYGMMC